MKKLFLVMAMVLVFGIGSAFGLNVKVVFDTSAEPTDRTVVLVSEISGDYSSVYGQVSEPGANSVDIGNIVNKKQYYFVAYRLTTGGEKSSFSEEYPYIADEPIELPVVYDLPPVQVPGVVLNISVSISKPGVLAP